MTTDRYNATSHYDVQDMRVREDSQLSSHRKVVVTFRRALSEDV